MIIDAEDHYSDEAKARADAANPHVQKWIALMQRFQQPIPAAGPDGTWMAMDCIYRLTDHLDFHAIARCRPRARKPSLRGLKRQNMARRRSGMRSEKRRVGQECVSTGKSR